MGPTRGSVQDLDISTRLRAELALERLAMRPGESVGDFGCATGYVSALLADTGASVVAIDIAASNLDAVGRNYGDLVSAGRLRLLEASLTSIPIESATLDAGVCMEVLEHIEDAEAAAAEIARTLRPGGRLVVSVPNSDAPLPLVERLGLASVHDHEGPERHVREGYTEAELRALLEAAGLEVPWIGGLGGPAYRIAIGLVSLVHLGYRRLRGQQSWTWSDVEQDRNSGVMRAYAQVFPAFERVARIGNVGQGKQFSSLFALARRPG